MRIPPLPPDPANRERVFLDDDVVQAQ